MIWGENLPLYTHCSSPRKQSIKLIQYFYLNNGFENIFWEADLQFDMTDGLGKGHPLVTLGEPSVYSLFRSSGNRALRVGGPGLAWKDFGLFPLWEGMVALKGLIFNSLYCERVVGLERTNSFYNFHAIMCWS